MGEGEEVVRRSGWVMVEIEILVSLLPLAYSNSLYAKSTMSPAACISCAVFTVRCAQV